MFGNDTDWPVFFDYSASLFGSELGDALLDGPHSTVLDLRSGPAPNQQYTVDLAGVAIQSSLFYLGQGMGLTWTLGCYHPERPADGWLSIAETFEFTE